MCHEGVFGRFCGHVAHGNAPAQIAGSRGAGYDQFPCRQTRSVRSSRPRPRTRCPSALLLRRRSFRKLLTEQRLTRQGPARAVSWGGLWLGVGEGPKERKARRRVGRALREGFLFVPTEPRAPRGARLRLNGATAQRVAEAEDQSCLGPVWPRHAPCGQTRRNSSQTCRQNSDPRVRPLLPAPWVTDPNFADRYRPDKTSTVLTQHSQPAQPTPMQSRSSIMQAAQQGAPETGRTPVCAACSKIIRGRYLVALGRSWHPEEFTCSQCKVVLEVGGFFEERGSIFCTKCYDSRYAPNCAKCRRVITGEIMHALKMTYHVQCFLCAACKVPIRNQAFYMEEGEPYCERDYEKMFGTKCHGCDFKIDAGDRFLEALGYSWHDSCFVCAVCQMNLEGKTFYSKKDKPLCKGHAFTPL
ncbi:hypothetical protein ANANG_G00068200 [Anguilla anguilla]|uniref:LIM zinc-binding domain-containing protein n=1 Tax=Anguilla anguilla TaxID=7936 RepID=A0A9D3S357_ANGAN|nr:hypothetical protein ANANG_G00068200 [Anguilla anguilla]